jgi:hypothetical protein
MPLLAPTFIMGRLPIILAGSKRGAIMNRCFIALRRQDAWLSGRVLLLSIACLPLVWLIAWSAIGISKAAARTPVAHHEDRADPALQHLRRRASSGDLASTRLLVATLLGHYEAGGRGTALHEAFDRLAQSWTQDEAFGPEAAQAYVARYCDRDALAFHPFCEEAE